MSGSFFQRVLVPVANEDDGKATAAALRPYVAGTDCTVIAVHVIAPASASDAESDGEDLLKFAEYVLGPDVATATELEEAADTTDTIVEKARSHDLMSIGAPEEKSRLEQVVYGPVQDTLSELSQATVLMSRDSDQTMRSLYYRWKRGIEKGNNSGEFENGSS